MGCGGRCFLVFYWFCCFTGIGQGQKSQFQPFWSINLPCIAVWRRIRDLFLLWETHRMSELHLAPSLSLSLFPFFLLALIKKKENSGSIVQCLTSQSCKAVEMVLSGIKKYFDISKSFYIITGNCKALHKISSARQCCRDHRAIPGMHKMHCL